MNHEGSITVRTFSTRPRRCITAVAIFTALSLGSTQALAQTPVTAPAPAAPATPAAAATPAPAATPPAPAAPTVDHTRSPDAPLSVEGPDPAGPATAPSTAPAGPQPPETLATPEPPPLPSEPPPPEPVVGPTPPPTPPSQIPVAHDTTRGNQLRVAGIGTMAGGGVVSLLGFALTLAGTIQGRKRHDELAGAEDERQRQDCSRTTSKSCTQLATQIDDLNDKLTSSNKLTQIGGFTMLTGFVVIAAGGLVYRIGIRKLQPPAMSRIKLTPSIGGLVLSGRF